MIHMTKTFEAIVANGVLKPTEPVELPENQRLRVTVEDVVAPSSADQRAARQRLVEFLRRSPLHIEGRLPTREQLYDDRV